MEKEEETVCEGETLWVGLIEGETLWVGLGVVLGVEVGVALGVVVGVVVGVLVGVTVEVGLGVGLSVMLGVELGLTTGLQPDGCDQAALARHSMVEATPSKPVSHTRVEHTSPNTPLLQEEIS